MVPAIDLIGHVVTGVMLGLLAIAAAHDVCFRTLPDKISIGLACCGAAEHVVVGDIGRAVLAAAAVFFVSTVAWRFGVFGGGDAKLLGAATLAVPLAAIPNLLLDTALAGGILALAFLALRPFVPSRAGHRPNGLFQRILRAEAWRIRHRGPLPYAVAIAAGGATSLLGG